MENFLPSESTHTTSLAPDATHLFLADAHLGASTDKANNSGLEENLINLVEYCRKWGYYLHVLGDLFDYWMEYPDRTPPVGHRLRNAFKEYHQNVGATLYVTGNHDNWDWYHFKSLGFDVEHECRLLKLGGLHLLALHGDGLQDKRWNLPRPLLHRMLRNHYFIKFYQKVLPPKAGWHLMRLFSGTSRWGELHSMEKKQHKLNEWAEHNLNKHDLDGILFGHDHKPRKLRFNGNFLLNPGSFQLFHTLGMYTSGQFKIVTWSETEGLSDYTKKYYLNRS